MNYKKFEKAKFHLSRFISRKLLTLLPSTILGITLCLFPFQFPSQPVSLTFHLP